MEENEIKPTAFAANLDVTNRGPNYVTLDGEGQGPLAFKVVRLPARGRLTDSGNPGVVIYEAAAGFVGKDSFDFVVECGGAASEPATVTLGVVDNPHVI